MSSLSVPMGSRASEIGKLNRRLSSVLSPTIARSRRIGISHMVRRGLMLVFHVCSGPRIALQPSSMGVMFSAPLYGGLLKVSRRKKRLVGKRL